MKIQLNILWWLSPIWTFGGIVPSLAFLAFTTSEADYRLSWGTWKYFQWTDFITVLFSTVAFLVGAVLTSTGPILLFKQKNLHNNLWNKSIPWKLINKLFNIGFYLTLFGYIAWIAVAFSRGLNLGHLTDVIAGQSGAIYKIRAYAETVPGITTFTQFGISTVILGILLGDKQGFSKIRIKLCVLVFVAAVRAFFQSERLALIEVVEPGLTLYLGLIYLNPFQRKRRMKILHMLIPIIGLALVFSFFSFTEYFRSWVNFYSSEGNIGFLRFSLLRIVGYYITALNNGALLVQDLHPPLPIPYYTFEWFWTFPVIESLLDYDKLIGMDLSEKVEKLVTFEANLEFNNTSGIFLPILDYGYIGGVIYWLLMGLLAGFLYRLFTQGNFKGLILYPLFYMGILEAPRFLYWPLGRVFPAWLLLFFVIGAKVFLSKRRLKGGAVV